jgi:Helix-turn-helix domain
VLTPLPRGVLRDAVLLPDDPAHRAGEGLLRRGDLSVTDVCFAVGCTSLGSFSARFTELVGETPSTYRARNHDELRVVPACQTMVLTRPRRSNIVIRQVHTRTGIKWEPLVGLAGVALYGLLMLVTATVVRDGGPGWVDLSCSSRSGTPSASLA